MYILSTHVIKIIREERGATRPEDEWGLHSNEKRREEKKDK